MTDSVKIHDILKANNPFSSNAAGDPREDRWPDVPGLGDDVFTGLKNLFSRKADNPHMPCAAAVLGEAGSGKTHLIGRLIDESKTGRAPFAFAYIPPFIDPSQGFRYLLREIVVNLTRGAGADDGLGQLDFLAGNILIYVLKSAAKATGKEILDKIAGKHTGNPAGILRVRMHPPKMKEKVMQWGFRLLTRDAPELSPDFVKVLLQYCFYEARRPGAVQWLMGRAVDVADMKMLGVRDRSGGTSRELEQEAQEMLGSMDMLLHRFGRSLAVFFDQLENLYEPDQIRKFQSMIYFLSDIRKAMLPVAFFRAQDWELKFKEQFDDFCSGRFKANMFDLKGCNPDQALALIRSRLDLSLTGVETPNDMHPFFPGHEKQLRNMLRAREIHPRLVINRANRLLHTILWGAPPKKRSPGRILTEAWQTRCQEVLANIDQYPPDVGRLVLALNLYLTNRPDKTPYRMSGVKTGLEKQKYISLVGKTARGDGTPVPVVFMVDVELHHRSVAASLRRGVAHLKNNPEGKALYIRDVRCPFHGPDRWKENNALLQEMLMLGGHAIFLDVEHAARWYALARLKFDVEAGDVSSDAGGAITLDDLKAFLRSHADGDKYPAFHIIDSYFSSRGGPRKPVKSKKKPNRNHSGNLAGLAVAILKQSPTRMMKADLLARKISKKAKIKMEVDRLVLILGGHKRTFNIFRARDGVILSLKSST